MFSQMTSVTGSVWPCVELSPPKLLDQSKNVTVRTIVEGAQKKVEWLKTWPLVKHPQF